MSAEAVYKDISSTPTNASVVQRWWINNNKDNDSSNNSNNSATPHVSLFIRATDKGAGGVLLASIFSYPSDGVAE